DAHPARALGDQPAPVRQQGQPPRMVETRGDDRVAERCLGADAGRAGLAVEGRTLIGGVGGAVLDRIAGRGGGGRVLPLRPAGGGEGHGGDGNGESGKTHGDTLVRRRSGKRNNGGSGSATPAPSATT